MSRVRQLTSLAAALAAAAWGCGCIVVPSGLHAHVDDGAHRHIDARVVDGLKPGDATRADVLRELGDPSVVLSGGKILVYCWATRQEFRFVWLFVGLNNSAGGGFSREAEQAHFLALEFDDAGRLRGKRTKQDGRLNVHATGVDDVFD